MPTKDDKEAQGTSIRGTMRKQTDFFVIDGHIQKV